MLQLGHESAAPASGLERRASLRLLEPLVPTTRGFWVPEAQLHDPLRVAELLEELTRRDVAWLSERPWTAPLYRSGLRYSAQPLGVERWMTVPECLRAQYRLDCKCLAAWRAAELRLEGETAAQAFAGEVHLSDELLLYHIVVRRADGRTEDPSRLLGMP